MEYAEGGELLDLLEKNGKFSESNAKKLFKELVSAVHYLHCLRIAHRDLKPENILLDKKQKIKLSDFGLARVTDHNSLMTTQCGTPQYLAPEIINLGSENKDAYTTAIDMWSLGCVLYLILTNKQPFDGDDSVQLFTNISHAKYSFPTDPGCILSPDAKNLINRLLDVNPNTRITAEEVLKHPWLNNNSPPSLSSVLKLRSSGLDNNNSSRINSHKRKHVINNNELDHGLPEQKKSRPTANGGEKGRNSKI